MNQQALAVEEEFASDPSAALANNPPSRRETRLLATQDKSGWSAVSPKGWYSVTFLGRSISDPAEEEHSFQEIQVFMCLLDLVIASDSLLFAGDMAGSVRFWLYMEEQEGGEIIEFMNLEAGLREETLPGGGSSQSRSPIRKSERRPKKKVDGGKSDSSGSFNTSENEDRKKDDIHSSSDEKDDGEAQLKQIALDMKALHEDKSKLQMILDKKIEEAGIISGRVDDLESQLNKEKEDCERSQGRFERLADSLASDSLKSGTKEQGSSVNAGNDDPYNAYEMSPDDQRQKNGSAARKRSAALSTSEEEKTGKKRRVNGDDMVHMSGKYRSEDALESLKNSKGTESLKKLGEDGNNDEINVISSGNDFTDRVECSGVKHVPFSTDLVNVVVGSVEIVRIDYK
uniref:Uncharacterized protein n=1 Tax=Aegilops tauschii TaxID=37682 RepID=M8AKL4_AEGTA